MIKEYTQGVVNYEHSSRKADYLYRVSLKSLIRNAKHEILVVKETGRTWWDLPGGGMDHDESFHEAIARELKEEVNFEGDFTYRILAAEEPKLLERANIWQIRLIFEVTTDNLEFEPGEEGDEVAFISPDELRNSDDFAERKVYEYSLL